jgi:hypothetical protein
MFYSILDLALALNRILRAVHQYPQGMPTFFFKPNGVHERSIDEFCYLFCSSYTHVGSEFLFKVHGDVCDRDYY